MHAPAGKSGRNRPDDQTFRPRAQSQARRWSLRRRQTNQAETVNPQSRHRLQPTSIVEPNLSGANMPGTVLCHTIMPTGHNPIEGARAGTQSDSNRSEYQAQNRSR